MTNLMEKFETKQIEKLISKKRIPTFRSGDTLKVTINITEGDKSRLQAFEGMCIARKNNSINSNFTVRKISHGEGVERVFPLFSPIIEKIEVVRKGDVNRAKLYYLRKLTGKRARIADKDRGDEIDQYEFNETTSDQENLIKKDKKVEKNLDIEVATSEKKEQEITAKEKSKEEKREDKKKSDPVKNEAEIISDEKQS